MRRSIPLAALVLATLTAAGASPAAEAGTTEPLLRVSRVERAESGTTSAVVTLPLAGTGETLPADAFTVTKAGSSTSGRAMAVERVRLTDRPFDVSLVLDPARDPMARNLLVSAAVEFLLRMPPTARISVWSAGATSAELTEGAPDDRRTAEAVARVDGARTAPLATTLDRIVTQDDASRPGKIVVFTTAGAETIVEDLEMHVEDMMVAGMATYFVSPNAHWTSAAQLVRLAESTGGRALEAPADAQLTAFDLIADDLLGQYELRFDPGTAPASVTVRVQASRLDVTAELALPDLGQVTVLGSAVSSPPRNIAAAAPGESARALDQPSPSAGAAGDSDSERASRWILLATVTAAFLAFAVVALAVRHSANRPQELGNR